MNENSIMIAIALSLGVSLGTLAQKPIIYAKENTNWLNLQFGDIVIILLFITYTNNHSFFKSF